MRKIKIMKSFLLSLLLTPILFASLPTMAADYTHTLITYSKANVNLGDAVQDICNQVGITFNSTQSKL